MLLELKLESCLTEAQSCRSLKQRSLRVIVVGSLLSKVFSSVSSSTHLCGPQYSWLWEKDQHSWWAQTDCESSHPICCQECAEFGVDGMDSKHLDAMLSGLDEQEIKTGPNFRTELISSRAKKADGHDAFLELVWPCAGGSSASSAPFSHVNPKMRDAGMTDLACATACLRMIVHDHLVPLVQKGASGQEQLLELCRMMLALIDEKPKVGPVLQGALDELEGILCFFVAVASPWQKFRNASADTIMDIKSAKHGAKSLVKHSINQSPHWKQLQAEYCKIEQASVTFGPQLQTTIDDLRSDKDGACRSAIEKIPAWKETLGERLLEGVMEALRVSMDKTCSHILQEVEGSEIPLADGLQTELADFTQLSAFASQMLGFPIYKDMHRRAEDCLAGVRAKSLEKRAEDVMKRIDDFGEDSSCSC